MFTSLRYGALRLDTMRYLSPTSPVSRYRQLILPDHALCDFLSDVGFEPVARLSVRTVRCKNSAMVVHFIIHSSLKPFFPVSPSTCSIFLLLIIIMTALNHFVFARLVCVAP